MTSPGFLRQLFQRGDQADSIVQPSPTLAPLSLLCLSQCCRMRKGCRAPSLLRGSRREFAEGRNQKSARKSRMAIILLFLPKNAINHCCITFLWYLQKPSNLLLCTPPKACKHFYCYSHLIDEGKRYRDTFPGSHRKSQD